MDIATLKTAIQTPIQVVGELVQLIKTNTVDYYKTTSLAESTKLARVEPITVVSRDLANYENTSDVMHAMLNIFIGYYLQAVALSARVGNVRVVKVLDRLNPDRDSSGFFVSLEDRKAEKFSKPNAYKYRLPRLSMEGRLADALMAGDDLDTYIQNEAGRPKPEHGSATMPRDVQKNIINEAANLAVGKLINVTITVDEYEMEVPVSVRLAASLLGESAVTHLMTIKKTDNSLVERYHAWRSGRIQFIRDLVFCQDMIDEHRKALISDKDGVYSEIIKRVNNAKKYGLLSQNSSLASASNVFVISEAVAKDVENALGGKLDNARIREKMFDNTYAMLVAVVDRDWERVTIYTRGISSTTSVSIKDIKSINKQKGPDIADVLSQLARGSAPSF